MLVMVWEKCFSFDKLTRLVVEDGECFYEEIRPKPFVVLRNFEWSEDRLDVLKEWILPTLSYR